MRAWLLIIFTFVIWTACQPNEPTSEAAAETTKSLRRDTMSLEACDYLSMDSVARAFGTSTDMIRIERLPNMANTSTCIWSWDNSGKQLILNVEYNDVHQDVPERYENYFRALLEEGELINPYDSTAGSYTYEQLAGLGDAALWSAAGRQLRWRIGNRYLAYLKLQSEGEMTVDPAAFRQLATEIIAALPPVE